MTGPQSSAIPTPALDGPGTHPILIASPVPGLSITREPGARECWGVVHQPSGVPVIVDLAGLATAEIVAEALGELTRWDRSAAEVADAADRLCYVEPGVEAVARKHGGTTLGQIAVYAP